MADDKIPYIRDFFTECDALVLLPGETITQRDLCGADLLITRTVTTVNEQILNNTNVKWVGTATTGTDHIDIAWLHAHNIALATAAGANANAVVQYVLSCIAATDPSRAAHTVGIIGCGRIGADVAHVCQSLGYRVLCYDPLLKHKPPFEFVDHLEALCAQSDVITIHTPLTKEGPHPTHHLVNATLLNTMKPGTILINAARGGVIDQRDLLRTDHLQLCLDVWEHEPHISLELLNKVFIGSPHIAGYSHEAKYRATQMMHDAATTFFGWPKKKPPAITLPHSPSTYDPIAHTQQFRAAFVGQADASAVFVRERKNYPLR